MNVTYRTLVLASLTVAAVYLGVSAPPPLPVDSPSGKGVKRVSVVRVFETLARENDVVRALYTRDIVGRGGSVGLRFDEDWRDTDVEAGPLPALFLREAATSIRRSNVPLGLFLGSDHPIASANQFSGGQAEAFARIKATRRPEFFFAEDVLRHTAMFPDIAAAEPCVSCHNEHPDSPKTDWALGDVMGATTWTFPNGSLTEAEYLEMVRTVREGFRFAYTEYLSKVEAFEDPPQIGDQWPADGYFLPSEKVFMDEFARRASAKSMDLILSAETL